MSSRRTVLIAAALAALAALSACSPLAAPPAVPVVAEGDGPLVAFYGDSYTLGTGASDPALRWSTQIAERRGWREFNPSVNGLGFVNNRGTYGAGDLPDQIIAQQPDIVFVTMGLNDNFSYSRAAAEIEAQIAIDLRRLREGLPDARIIVVEPFWYTAEQPESLGIIAGWVQREAQAIGADHIAGASDWIAGRPGEMAADGLHPNDEGYALMTRLMEEALAELGL
ncbi:SGNH/GDSL hydrolase family protein [Microcella humidisoli]|jgi:lysophospholipase L1-like esterase|uniref:SGNH/GDSL hydrolase family protein n=1 Tax=Microcella humidisoli TaxID=2963406 RepID=A0ABY5FXW5_9MICO|nr:SGNH/GDSL hydrolase family protein [Microcella humidisoli]UTT63162.1 SGNH/GDSL hydrolase family protein [Microcella humidisoli]